MKLPVWYVYLYPNVNLGEYVAAPTPGKARAIGSRDASGANYQAPFTRMRVLVCCQDGKRATADVRMPRNLATYEVCGVARTDIHVFIDAHHDARYAEERGVYAGAR